MIGINPAALNSQSRGKDFVNDYGLTFANLWDKSSQVYRHYGTPYNSHYWLLDKNGDRVGARAVNFSTSGAQQKLDSLD